MWLDCLIYNSKLNIQIKLSILYIVNTFYRMVKYGDIEFIYFILYIVNIFYRMVKYGDIDLNLFILYYNI